MDDRFLSSARTTPRPEFATALRRRLAAEDAARRSRRFPLRRVLSRTLTVLVPAAAAVLVLAVFPDVRAGATAFLELFRVKKFVAVNVDPVRLNALEKGVAGPNRLLGDVKIVRAAEPPRRFATAAEAFAAAGFAGLEPGYVPSAMHADSAVVLDGQEVELTLDARKLNELLVSLGAGDVSIPPEFDGGRVHARTARTVGIRYRGKISVATLMQSPLPELSLPPGLERARLAEIGLRAVGLPADEAKRFAQRVDWNSTMLIPLPTGNTRFREIDVRGNPGLLVEEVEREDAKKPVKAGAPRTGPQRVLLWSNGERIFAIGSDLPDVMVLEMANSIP